MLMARVILFQSLNNHIPLCLRRASPITALSRTYSAIQQYAYRIRRATECFAEKHRSYGCESRLKWDLSIVLWFKHSRAHVYNKENAVVIGIIILNLACLLAVSLPHQHCKPQRYIQAEFLPRIPLPLLCLHSRTYSFRTLQWNGAWRRRTSKIFKCRSWRDIFKLTNSIYILFLLCIAGNIAYIIM